MAMSTASSGAGLTNEINVTPMIDVLLVLLVIFMVAVPLMRKAIDVQLPDPNPTVTSAQNSSQIVLQVLADGNYRINSTNVPKAQLDKELHTIYDARPDKIIFIKADPSVKFQDVVHAMDISRGAGVKVLGLAPKDTPGATPAGVAP